MSEREHIDIDPGVREGQACLGGTRLPCRQMGMVWWQSDWSLSQMLDNWPGLTETGLKLSCWYLARYGGYRWRQRWAVWLHNYGLLMYLGEYDAVTLPPQRREKPR